MTRTVDVVVSYLEMTSPDELRPSRATPAQVELRMEEAPDAAPIAAAMYDLVGGDWHWRDRAPWTDADWDAAIHRDGVELWTLTEDGAALGFFELAQAAGTVEILYFGLAATAIGRGLGGWLLTKAVERAWAMGAERVILNTCTLDGPAALPNYVARGFRVVRTLTQQREIPS